MKRESEGSVPEQWDSGFIVNCYCDVIDSFLYLDVALRTTDIIDLLLLSLGEQHERRGMRAQKVILRGPFARPPTPFAQSSAPSRCSCGSHRSARPLLGSENTLKIFWCSFTMRMSRSAWLLSKGTVKSSIKANTSRLWATKRSSRFLGGLCLTRPRFLGCPSTHTAVGLACSPSAIIRS